LEESNTDPEMALVIGDSLNDVLTGRNAGMWTCGVTYGFAPGSLREAAPDVIVDTPRELQSLFSS
jgi:phosphoglycolate phosphatase